MITIYKYIYIEAKIGGMFSDSEHRTLIEKYSQEGWRFVAAIPTKFTGNGHIREVDLVFEKEDR